MIIDTTESRIVSSLGWIDKSALWTYDVASGRTHNITISDAAYVSLHPGQRDMFACVHHSTNRLPALSAHMITSPGQTLSRISVDDERGVIEGDATVWQYLPAAYVAQGVWDGRIGQRLILVHAESRAIEVQRMEWFDDHYDLVYQRLLDVAPVPSVPHVVISIQRDSHPVLYDPLTRTVVRRISLAGRAGNPILRFRQTAPELWATDYDMIVRLTASDWLLVDALKIQQSAAGTAQFIGDIAFDRAEHLCAIARPASRDVIALDTKTFQVSHRAETGHQPIEVVIRKDGRVFSRDWHTGELRSSTLMPIVRQ